jgi:hypothetical protein
VRAKGRGLLGRCRRLDQGCKVRRRRRAWSRRHRARS